MGKVYSIQYVRAVAALIVVAFHAHLRVQDSLSATLAQFFTLGHAGVDLFFVISGFIIWTIGARKEYNPADFMYRRALRVAPMYWIATILWTLAAVSGALAWVDVTSPHVLKSLFFIPHYSPELPGRIYPILIPGWTLTYEIFFYFLFSLSLLLPRGVRLPAFVGTLIGLVALGEALHPQVAWAVIYTSPMLLEFLFGCLVGALWLAAPGSVGRNAAVFTAGIILFVLLAWNTDPDDLWSRTIGYGLPAVFIVSGVAGLGSALPRLSLFERLGDASYSIYLFHLFVIVVLARLWTDREVLDNTTGALAFIALSLVVSAWVGLVIFDRVESPLQRSLRGRPLFPSRAEIRSRQQ